MQLPAALLPGAVAAALLFGTPAWSQSNIQAKIQPHLVSAGGSSPCTQTGSRPACAEIVTAGSLAPSLYYAYILVTDGSSGAGVAGLQFGIDYDGAAASGVDVFSWTRCATLDFAGAGWPAAGTGNLITWDPQNNCQIFEPGGNGSGVVAVAGFLYLSAYSDDLLSMVPHPAVGLAKVADCTAAESIIPLGSLGAARFSNTGLAGSNPCQGVGGGTPPSCSIIGLSTLQSGASSAYSVSVAGQNPTFSWSISGRGSIIGPANMSQVTVLAGNPGSFTLSVQFASSAGSGSCSRTVSVYQSEICNISGPHVVSAGTLTTYTPDSSSPSGTYQWTVSGPASIVGSSTNSSVQVQAGASGSFTISLSINSTTECSKVVTISTTPPEGPNQQNAKILVHLRAPTIKNACGTLPACNQVVTNGGLYPPSLYYAFVLVADGYTTGSSRSGVAGVQFGIQYNGTVAGGVDIFSWSLCAALEFSSTGWPSSGGGNLITWDPINNCQRIEPGGTGTGVVATAGYFYLGAYTPDLLRITPRPVDGAAKVANCFSAESLIAGGGINPSPSPLGHAGFGGLFGYNPCGIAVPVENTTWSRIKAMTHSK